MQSTKLAVALRVGRAALGWSQIEASHNLGIAKSTLAKIETNEIKPSAEMVMAIVRTYSDNGVTLDFLFGDEIKVSISAEAIESVQARLDDPAQRRSDRLTPLEKHILELTKAGLLKSEEGLRSSAGQKTPEKVSNKKV